MTSPAYDALNKALTSALDQYAETMGEPFDVIPKLDVVEDDAFWALAEIEIGQFVIRVSTGTVDVIANLWRDAQTDTEWREGVFGSVNATAEELTHASLTWLMLHEMHHWQMRHFAVVGRAYLTESFGAHRFAVATRAMPRASWIERLDKKDWPKVEPCLEMQADHDALEMLLDAYSKENWSSLRARVAAVSAVMMLVEREDAKHKQEHSSHPRAATRMFQLLGHLIQMPSVQAMLAEKHPELGIDPVVPSDQEHGAYTERVVVPAFFDAVNLARIADTNVIREDLGEPEDFFRDVEIALMRDPTQFNELVTDGANQWAELMAFNAKLLSNMNLDN